MEYRIIHNQPEQCFELAGRPDAYVEYEIQNDTVAFVSTHVPADLEGKGLGSALVKFALDHAIANHWKYEAICPFVKIYIQRHPGY